MTLLADTGPSRSGPNPGAQARERALAQYALNHEKAAYLLAAEPGHGQGGAAFAYNQQSPSAAPPGHS